MPFKKLLSAVFSSVMFISACVSDEEVDRYANRHLIVFSEKPRDKDGKLNPSDMQFTVTTPVRYPDDTIRDIAAEIELKYHPREKYVLWFEVDGKNLEKDTLYATLAYLPKDDELPADKIRILHIPYF